MKVDPCFTMWLGVVTTIMQAIATGTVHLSGLIPTDYIPVVAGWMGLIVFVNMTVLTALAGLSSSKPGPLAPPPTIAEAQAVMESAQKAV